MMKDFSLLEQKLGFNFQNKDLLVQAFAHRSYLNENPAFHLSHNERLEFLGDAVLELVVTERLYRDYPNQTEGELTSWRAALVNTRMLSQVARELDLNEFLLLSRGEQKETGKAREYILANTMEALIGSLYMDQGLESCRAFIEQNILGHLPEILEQRLFQDGKSLFQELAQEKVSITPSYAVLKEWGPDHAKHFRTGVYLGDELAGEGEGSSKQEAEEEAARDALIKKGWT
ncbi:MAG: ribonuclease III [Candidatus Yanofskybacteria bacterium]|nr:ribonuclease III [Candidatus Yanofskybacteria bacterium]